jgi:hypothetical protein
MADFNFVGAAYSAPSIYQDSQECINWYPEVDPTKNPGTPSMGVQGMRGVVALYPTPGLMLGVQLPNVAPVRAMHTLPGSTAVLTVCGSSVYLINSGFNYTYIGELRSNTGYCQIQDNNIDAMIVDVNARYSYNIATQSLTMIPYSDGAFVGGSCVDVVDNYLVYTRPDSQQWAATDALSTATQPLSFASKFGSSDNVVGLIVDHRQVYLLGEFTSEVWVNGGLFPFPFEIIPGSSMQHGCAAVQSISRLGNSFALLTKDTRGQSIVAQMNGYSMQRISTHAVENSMVGQTISDAIAYTYQIEGHEFYVMTLPSIGNGLTWVYDLATGLWHKWLSWSASTGYGRHRSNCCAVLNGQVIVGDYQNGMVYYLSQTAYTDNGQTIRRLRRAPHLTSDLQRQYFHEFQIQFQPGVGLSSGQGQVPQAMLKWSNDGGSTWTKEFWTSMGSMGNYNNRAIWRRLGWSRDRIFEVVVTDPINATIISANLKATGAAN